RSAKLGLTEAHTGNAYNITDASTVFHAGNQDEEAQIAAARIIIRLLPATNFALFAYLFAFFTQLPRWKRDNHLDLDGIASIYEVASDFEGYLILSISFGFEFEFEFEMLKTSHHVLHPTPFRRTLTPIFPSLPSRAITLPSFSEFGKYILCDSTFHQRTCLVDFYTRQSGNQWRGKGERESYRSAVSSPEDTPSRVNIAAWQRAVEDDISSLRKQLDALSAFEISTAGNDEH
ncbi:hypothetical protein BD410DRAFT_810084, partial [Rickenella mellea]